MKESDQLDRVVCQTCSTEYGHNNAGYVSKHKPLDGDEIRVYVSKCPFCNKWNNTPLEEVLVRGRGSITGTHVPKPTKRVGENMWIAERYKNYNDLRPTDLLEKLEEEKKIRALKEAQEESNSGTDKLEGSG